MKIISFERVMLSLIFLTVIYACYLLSTTASSPKAFGTEGLTTTKSTTGSDSTGGKDTVPKIGETMYVINPSAPADCDCCPGQMKLYLRSTTTDTTGGGSGGGPHRVYEVYRIDQE